MFVLNGKIAYGAFTVFRWPEIMFRRHPDFEKRKKSAIALVKYLLANKSHDVLATHRRELITRVLLFKLSEAECCGNKYNTRFQSRAAANRDTRTELRHDHVYLRSNIVKELETAGADEVAIDAILEKVIGCAVTEQEHLDLTKLGKEYDGWERYQKAGIEVVDTEV